jgi:hypothetical protein
VKSIFFRGIDLELVEFGLDFLNIPDIEDIGYFPNISDNYHTPDTEEIPDSDSINNIEDIYGFFFLCNRSVWNLDAP